MWRSGRRVGWAVRGLRRREGGCAATGEIGSLGVASAGRSHRNDDSSLAPAWQAFAEDGDKRRKVLDLATRCVESRGTTSTGPLLRRMVAKALSPERWALACAMGCACALPWLP